MNAKPKAVTTGGLSKYLLHKCLLRRYLDLLALSTGEYLSVPFYPDWGLTTYTSWGLLHTADTV